MSLLDIPFTEVYRNMIIWVDESEKCLRFASVFNPEQSKLGYSKIGVVTLTNISYYVDNLEIHSNNFINATVISCCIGVTKEHKSIILGKSGVDILSEKHITTMCDCITKDDFCIVNCSKYENKSYVIDSYGNLVKLDNKISHLCTDGIDRYIAYGVKRPAYVIEKVNGRIDIKVIE